MPQIREYVAQGTPQARLPGGAGAVAGQAAAQAAGAMEQLGQTLASVVSHYEDVRRDTVAAKAAATATRDLRQFVLEMQEGSQDEQGNFTPPADPIEHPARFKAKVQEINDTYGRELGDENMVSRFQTRFAPHVTASLLDVQKVSLDRQKEQVNADILEAEDRYLESIVLVASGPGEIAAVQAATQAMNGIYDAAVTAGSLKAPQAAERKATFAHRIAAELVTRDVLNDPEEAKKRLAAGDFDAYLNEAEKATLIKRADVEIRSREIEAERLQRKQERLLAEQREATKDEFVGLWAGNDLSAETILASDLLSGEKEHFLRLIATDSSATKDDPTTFFDLFRRVHLPVGDDRKIVNENQLFPYVGKGLGITGLNHLRKELQDIRNPQNLSLTEARKKFLQGTKSAITKSTLLGTDPEGDRRYYTFWQYVLAKEEELRSKGEDVFQLYNPRSKDFLGAPEVLQMFQSTPAELMESVAESMRRPATEIQWPEPTVPTRREGETAEQYLRRIGEAGP